MEKQKSYEKAYEIACNNLKKISFSEVIDKIKYSGAIILETREDFIKFKIKLFNDFYIIDYPNFNFEKENGGIVSLVTKIILLHYINNIDPFLKPLDNLVSYKYIPGAFNYYPVFQKKAITPLLEKYNSLEKIKSLFKKLSAEQIEMGDFSFKIKALPKIDIIVIYWDGDEEFPPNLDFLFDESIKDMLSLEDIVVISQMLSKRLLFLD